MEARSTLKERFLKRPTATGCSTQPIGEALRTRSCFFTFGLFDGCWDQLSSEKWKQNELRFHSLHVVSNRRTTPLKRRNSLPSLDHGRRLESVGRDKTARTRIDVVCCHAMKTVNMDSALWKFLLLKFEALVISGWARSSKRLAWSCASGQAPIHGQTFWRLDTLLQPEFKGQQAPPCSVCETFYVFIAKSGRWGFFRRSTGKKCLRLQFVCLINLRCLGCVPFSEFQGKLLVARRVAVAQRSSYTATRARGIHDAQRKMLFDAVSFSTPLRPLPHPGQRLRYHAMCSNAALPFCTKHNALSQLLYKLC